MAVPRLLSCGCRCTARLPPRRSRQLRPRTVWVYPFSNNRARGPSETMAVFRPCVHSMTVGKSVMRSAEMDHPKPRRFPFAGLLCIAAAILSLANRQRIFSKCDALFPLPAETQVELLRNLRTRSSVDSFGDLSVSSTEDKAGAKVSGREHSIL